VLIVALTGGIATGKSVVAEVLSEKGCFVQNADQIAHQLIAPESDIWSSLINYFGRGILKDDSTIDRKKLGEIVYRNPEDREFLNHLTHPRVLEKVKQTVNQLEKTGSYEIYITEAALLVEAGYYNFYDRIILTHCVPEIQVQRLSQRDGISREKALEKIRAQMPDEEKFPYADYLIDTSGTLSETIEQAERVFLNLYQDVLLKKSGQLIKNRS
jgi:dephospho-CoA kinase